MTHISAQERGGVLLYAVIAVAFLSGLSLYLQKMSDPKIFQTNDTQKILNVEYLSDSIGILLSVTAYNNQSTPKKNTDIFDYSICSPISGSNEGFKEEFISKLTDNLNKQKNIFLFSKNKLLIASATSSSSITNTSINIQKINNQCSLPITATASSKYDLNLPSIYVTKRKISLNLFFNETKN